MPFFGVDDILFLLASTTALLWAKRADVVETSVYATLHLLTNDPKEAARRAAAAAAAQGSPPTLLLKGFDLDAEERSLLSLRDGGSSLSMAALPSPLTGGEDKRRPRDAFAEAADAEEVPLLVKESVHAQFREEPVVYQIPQVPHRHYNPRRRQQHVSSLATASEEEVKQRIARYSVAEVQTLFAKMERDGLWEAVVHVTYGIEQAQEAMRYLNLHNVECAIRTLLNTAHPDAALVYFFRFGEDMLVSDDILVALFHACRNDEQLSLELCHVLEPFRSQWTPTVYACCLTTTARFDYGKAIELYETYMETQRSRQHAPRGALRRVLASSSLLREAGVVADEAPLRLQYLYHIIIPLVVEHDPSRAASYVEDMLDNDPSAAPDVFLKCLSFAPGRLLAATYLRQLSKSENASEEEATVASAARKAAQTIASESEESIGEIARHLYGLRPSAMNMNTLLRLLTDYSTGQTKKAQQALAGARLPQLPVLSSREAILPAPSSPLSMKVLAGGVSSELAQLLRQVPLQSELDATVLARTITEQHASWGLATQFLSVMLRRKCFTIVPSIAAHVARQGRWATAARAMAVYLSNQRAAMTTAEAMLCIEASVHSGQWASALFWVERAHARGLALSPTTYDLALASSQHCQFEAAERVMTTMHDVGASCTERGVLSFIETAAHQGKVANAFRVLQHHSNVEWTP